MAQTKLMPQGTQGIEQYKSIANSKGMSATATNNKRIAKNAMALYFRMILITCVGLYTSRIILKVLGVNDYGIYNAVGGIIAMFNIIRGSLAASTQRYITYGLGKNDHTYLNKVFSTSVIIHICLAILIVLLAETIGLWFLYNKMIIPEERMVATFWVYQCVVASSVIMLISIPYNALIIAHEKMGIYAKISIFEAFAKLFIVFLLQFVTYDRLIVYAFLLVMVELSIRVWYTMYCKKNYKESNVIYQIDKSLIKEIAVFAGWSFFGNAAYITYTQGLNILLNTFFGPVVNAARGIAIQVQSLTHQLVTGFQTAINPQITKSYASGNLTYMHSLIFRSCKFSYYLILLISIPIIVETDTILRVWLGDYPENTVTFIRIILLTTLINSMANPLITAVKATGKVKKYESIVGGLMLTILPISYICLRLGYPPYSVFLVHLTIEIIAQNIRVLIVGKSLKFSFWKFFFNIQFRIIFITILASILPLYLHHISDGTIIASIAICTISVVCSAVVIAIFGLNKNERNTILHLISKKILKKK